MTKISGLSGILMAATMMAGTSSVPAMAQDNAMPNATNGQTASCFDPNTRTAPRRIRNITRDNAAQIYSSCLEAENWVEAVGILTSSEFDLGPNRWHAIDQLLAIYDGKIERQTELTARLQDDARNPATGKKWKGRERRNFQAELLQTDAWLRAANSAVNIQAVKNWRNANAPTVLSITPIAGTQCQTEVRVPQSSTLQQSFMTCGTWRAPQTGALHYQFRVRYESMPPAPAASAQPPQP